MLGQPVINKSECHEQLDLCAGPCFLGKGHTDLSQDTVQYHCIPSCKGEHCFCSDSPDFFLTLMVPCYLLKLRAQQKSLISNTWWRTPLNYFEAFLGSQFFLQLWLRELCSWVSEVGKSTDKKCFQLIHLRWCGIWLRHGSLELGNDTRIHEAFRRAWNWKKKKKILVHAITLSSIITMDS